MAMETNQTKTNKDIETDETTAPPAEGKSTETELASTRRGWLDRDDGYGPFAFARRLFENLDRALGFTPSRTQGSFAFVPQIEVSTHDGELIVKCDLPGLNAQDVDVTLQDDVLVISGERRSAHEQEDENTWRCERSYGAFRRVIPLPEGVDPESAEAHFVNGVLEVMLKAPRAPGKGRKIDINTPADKLTH